MIPIEELELLAMECGLEKHKMDEALKWAFICLVYLWSRKLKWLLLKLTQRRRMEESMSLTRMTLEDKFWSFIMIHHSWVTWELQEPMNLSHKDIGGEICMHDYTTQYINHCSVCIRAKKHNYKQHGVLCPLLILEGPWQWTESNHIVKLPKSKGFNSILYKIWRSTVVIPQLILVPCLEHHCPAQSLSSIQYLVYPSLAQHITISYVT